MCFYYIMWIFLLKIIWLSVSFRFDFIVIIEKCTYRHVYDIF